MQPAHDSPVELYSSLGGVNEKGVARCRNVGGGAIDGGRNVLKGQTGQLLCFAVGKQDERATV